MIYWDCYTTEYPTARKEHRCLWCHGTIFVGQNYRRTTGILEGRPQTQKWCQRCRASAANTEPGAWLRPEDALEDALEEKGYCGEIFFDGSTLELHGLDVHPRRSTPELYQAHIRPGGGLTEWVLVAAGRDDSGLWYGREVRSAG